MMMSNGWANIFPRHQHGTRIASTAATILALCLSLGSVAAQAPPGPPGGAPGGPPPPPSANVSVFATGVESPRGLRFGPDGMLYVAEGGLNGTNTTVGQCDQVPAPIGPYMGGKTARISKIDPKGNRTTVVDNLPSARDARGAESAMIGVGDVEFVGTTLYGLVTGGGCSHGNPSTPNTIIKVNADGTYTSLGDLGAFEKAHPVAKPEAHDFEPDGTWYSMVNVGGALYAVEPNHGEIDKVTTDGQISRVVDISASQGHIVPTAVAYHDGNFYVGNLGTFPITGASKILKITPSGQVSVVATGLSAVLGVAFDNQGRLYALEMSTAPNQGPVPGTGMVVRMTASGSWETVASGLFFPTGMTFGPDGMLYVSNMGFGPPMGQIVRVNVNASPTAAPAAPPTPPAVPAAAPPAASAPSAPPKTGGGLVNFVRRLGDG